MKRIRHRFYASAAVTIVVVVSVICVVVVQIWQQRNRERTYESRHPLFLSGLRRVVGAGVHDNSDHSQVRVISFGSSSTWGAGLKRVKDSYPHRISPQYARFPRNVAMKEGGGVLPAACTQSIVGDDDVYDVVTIEFDHSSFDESYAVLAKRLRRRFPEANIIFVQLWNPSQLTYRYSDNETTVDFVSWRRANGNIPLHSSELTMSVLESGPENWSVYQNPADAERLRKTMEEVNAGLVGLPTPTPTDFSFPQNLLSFLLFFTEGEPYRLSEEGHAVIASGLEHLVKPEVILGKDVKVRDATGSWGSGDQCNLWYYNGQYVGGESSNNKDENEDGENHSTNKMNVKSTGRRLGFSHVQETGEHKHALEFRRYEEGHLTVTNPFDEDRLLYLTYMTSNDEVDEKIYPRTRVRLNGRPSVVIDPYHEGSENHHLTRTSAVGMIAAGVETVVNLDPIESSMLHFRLVGASILGKEAIDILPIDFTLEPEPAAVDTPSFFNQIFQR